MLLMGPSQPRRSTSKGRRRGILTRPLEALVFLAPLLLLCEVISLAYPRDRVIAFDLLRRFVELFGRAGIWAPGLAVVVILLATHMASGQAWTVRWRRVALMYVEAAALAVPLLALSWAAPFTGTTTHPLTALDGIALGIGAGIYEELVFRLIFISVLMMIGVDLLGLDVVGVTMAAVLLSSLVFAAHHYQPFGVEPLNATTFCFRTMAGMYLAGVFWYRGYGPAAGCHAAYNVALAILH